jgi:hypothetical protein
VSENNKPPAYGDGWRAALRALPILRTCGECGWCGMIGGDVMERYCDHVEAPVNPTPPRLPRVDQFAAPPSWCPLRKEPAR